MTKLSNAQHIGLQAAIYLLEQDNLRERFCAMTGLSGDDFRARIEEDAFLCGIIEFFINHEPDLIGFSSWAAIEPDEIVKTWRVLGGSGEEFW